MRNFIRGERAKISQLSKRTRRFDVLLSFRCGTIPVLDFVCFGVDASNRLADDRYMIFYNQRAAPDNSIVLEELHNQRARFSVDLEALPPHVERLVFTASPENGGRLSQIDVSFATLREAGIADAAIVASYRFSGADFGGEGSLLVSEIYKKAGEWRFGAVGQGFAGNLPALLQHFGGQESEASDAATPAKVTAPATAPDRMSPSLTPPPPPVSAPLTPVTATVTAPLAPPAFAGNSALQKTIDAAPAGGKVQLVRGEFQGPILISKPLTLEGSGAVIWAQNGPVLRVSSVGVTLRDLEIEATAPDDAPHSKAALWIDEGSNATLQEVRVRGEIVGVAAARGTWKLPPFLNLGEFAARENNRFEFQIEVPHACELKANVAGVVLSPARVEAGRARIEMRVEGVADDTFLAGQIEVFSGGIGRTIALNGRSKRGAPVARGLSL